MKLQFISKIPFSVSTLTVTALILYATLSPDPLHGTPLHLFPNSDKVIHGIMFFALALAISYDYAKLRFPNAVSCVRSAIVIAILTAASGALVEVAQQAMGLGRSAELADAIADAIGAIAGAALWLPLSGKIFSKSASKN